ncbi:hypothetical protein SCHPADRAFT_223065 [Schizopora paradoxa]|uniref:F-box domain-containing protein n=1 Tax=Schizopora paradoxa TaxID=27342 RepID=A0A0H2RWE3_9AGAM|nr:hypothetical protein SCHPADRAFT_223065 [Schizopora paradoxa]
MHRGMYSRFRGNEVPDVLVALEMAARSRKIHLVDLQKVFSWENWRAFQNVYGYEDKAQKPSAALDDLDLTARLADAKSVSRFMESVSELDTIIKMLNVLLDSANGLQAKFQFVRENIVSKLSKGVGSLPDELLAKVFQLAVWEEGREGGKQAVRISHVCRKFRSIALGTRGLWTTLFSGASEHQLQTFISRAGPNEEFHAFYHFSTKVRYVGSSFTSICLPIISRWKTLTVSQEAQDWYHEQPMYGGVAHIMGTLVEFIVGNNLQLPILEELKIDGSSYDRYSDSTRDIAGYLWASNLRTFRCSFFLPYLSTNISSVSTLVVRHSFIDRPLSFDFDQRSLITPLLESLLAMPNLISFELEAHDAERIARDIALPKLELPSIISFHLRLNHFPVLEFDPKGSCIAMLMGTLVMPSLEALAISVGMVDFRTYKNEVNTTKMSQSLDELSRKLLPDRLSGTAGSTSLIFNLRDDSYKSAKDVPSTNVGVFSVPLERIIRVHSVTLSSFVPVLLTDELDDGGVLSTIPNGSCLLRELKFIECENMTSVDLEYTVDSLESLGIWNYIERVVVQDCKHLVYDEVVDLVGEERLQYLS